jgi:hypothetical protein
MIHVSDGLSPVYIAASKCSKTKRLVDRQTGTWQRIQDDDSHTTRAYAVHWMTPSI